MAKWLKIIPRWRGLCRFLRDPQADWKPKAAAALGALYLIWPADLMPDLIPFLGWLDDLGFEALVLWYLFHAIDEYEKKKMK